MNIKQVQLSVTAYLAVGNIQHQHYSAIVESIVSDGIHVSPHKNNDYNAVNLSSRVWKYSMVSVLHATCSCFNLMLRPANDTW